MTIKPARTKWEKEEEDSKVRFLKRQQRDKEADEQVDRYLKRPEEDEPDYPLDNNK